MHYFIVSVKVYIDSIYIAGGKFGRVSLLSVANAKPVIELVINRSVKILKPAKT